MLHIAIRLFMILYFALCMGDVVTTIGAISTGAAHEGNPVVAWVMKVLGAKWLLARLAMGMAVIYGFITYLDDTRWCVVAFLFGCLLTAYAVGSNWNLWRKSKN